MHTKSLDDKKTEQILNETNESTRIAQNAAKKIKENITECAKSASAVAKEVTKLFEEEICAITRVIIFEDRKDFSDILMLKKYLTKLENEYDIKRAKIISTHKKLMSEKYEEMREQRDIIDLALPSSTK